MRKGCFVCVQADWINEAEMLIKSKSEKVAYVLEYGISNNNSNKMYAKLGCIHYIIRPLELIEFEHIKHVNWIHCLCVCVLVLVILRVELLYSYVLFGIGLDSVTTFADRLHVWQPMTIYTFFMQSLSLSQPPNSPWVNVLSLYGFFFQTTLIELIELNIFNSFIQFKC